MLLYEKSADEALFEKLCEKVAGLIRIHPQFRKILQEVSESESIAVVVLTCGIRRVWEKVLTKLNLRSTITVMGGSRLADGYVMTPELKGSLLDRLKIKHGMYVCSIGDSKIDLDMLKAADESYLVTTEGSISKDMHAKLHAAIETEGLRVVQIILPQGSNSTLSTAIIPPAALDEAFIPRLVQHSARLKVYHATHKPASRLLASRTRNASVYGMQLQEAHKEAGWYLSIEYVSSILGLEPYDMQSVQGKAIQGHRLTHERRTCIVPMMSGGEPMALGVFEAFPEAMFHHAKNPQDIQSKHLENKDTLILVDWVINTGKGVVDFVKHIRQLSKQIRIVVVAGVVQNRTVGAGGMGGSLHESLADRGEVSLVALRISENSFKGRGGTDTGNRLWNTTHLD